MNEQSVPDRGYVAWLDLDPQAGNEMRKRRPVLFITKAAYNGSGLRLAHICPITSSAKNYPFQVPIEGVPGVSGVVQADQIKSVDWQARNAEFVGRVDEEIVLTVVGLLLALHDPDGVYSSDGGAAD